MYLNLLSTVHCPVSSRGRDIVNSSGVKVAECADTFVASAMAALINYGVPEAEAENKRHLEKENAIAAMIPKMG